MRKTEFTVSSRLKSFRYAFDGIASLLKNEHNSRIHLVAAGSVLALGLLLNIDLSGWISVAIVTGLVFITELINSAVEMISDLVDPNVNPAIKVIKDYSAASVLIAAITAVVVGGIIFIPALLKILK